MLRAGGPTRSERGRRAEQLARRLLAAEGYVIERANVRYPVGEIDLIAREGETLCFVEVRSASSSRWGGAVSSVSPRKRGRVLQAARWYLAGLRRHPAQVRFDVVAVQWGVVASPSVTLLRGAWSADGHRVGW